MAAIAISDVTVVIPSRDRDIIPVAPKLVSMCTVTFGDGALTYPATGVPLPAQGNFGFKREIQQVHIQQPLQAGIDYRYDPTNHSFRIYSGGTELLTDATPAAVTLDLLLIGE